MKILKQKINDLKNIIRDGESFLITTHLDPDGDAVGSSLAMAGYLLNMGKKVSLYDRDHVPENLKFLPNSELFKTRLSENDFNVTFILDCSEFERVSDDFPSGVGNLGKIVVIDHHRTSKELGTVNFIDSRASSTAELIFEIFELMEAQLDKGIAQSLYTAILTDTGSFRYSNSSPKAFRTAAKLVEAGASPWVAAQNFYENISIPRLKLTSMVLSTLEIYETERFASITMLKEMLKKSGALPESSDGLINYPRSLQGIEVAIFFKEISENKFKIGLRSKEKADVSEIASYFGGGGHKNAAGCSAEGNLQSVKKKLYEKTRTIIAKYLGDNTRQ